MAAPKGHPRWGGRAKGARNKAKVTREQAMARALREAIANAPGGPDITPLSAMLMVLRWGMEMGDLLPTIMGAAVAAAPYVHPRLNSSELRVRHEFDGMSDAELLIEAQAIERKLVEAQAKTIEGNLAH